MWKGIHGGYKTPPPSHSIHGSITTHQFNIDWNSKSLSCSHCFKNVIFSMKTTTLTVSMLSLIAVRFIFCKIMSKSESSPGYKILPHSPQNWQQISGKGWKNGGGEFNLLMSELSLWRWIIFWFYKRSPPIFYWGRPRAAKQTLNIDMDRTTSFIQKNPYHPTRSTADHPRLRNSSGFLKDIMSKCNPNHYG